MDMNIKLGGISFMSKGMSHREWVAKQFQVKILENGRISLKTPVIEYILSKEDFSDFRRKINEVKL